VTGATIQILLFAVMAIEVKRKAPTAHTVLEIVLVRWGRGTHVVFLVFCLLTNVLVTAMLILGGASVVAALTGKRDTSYRVIGNSESSKTPR
jgi:urea-proton symporter